MGAYASGYNVVVQLILLCSGMERPSDNDPLIIITRAVFGFLTFSFYLGEIVLALEHLHSNGIIYRFVSLFTLQSVLLNPGKELVIIVFHYCRIRCMCIFTVYLIHCYLSPCACTSYCVSVNVLAVHGLLIVSDCLLYIVV